MNSSPLDSFCPVHSESEASITAIATIVTKDDTLKFDDITKEFLKLGFIKVKDLARTSMLKASSVKLPGDSLTLLYEAMETYTDRLDKLHETAKSEHTNGNFDSTQKICTELLVHKPKSLDIILLKADSFLSHKHYEKAIETLEEAKNIHPNCFEVLYNLALVYWRKSEQDLAKQYLSEACELKPFCVNAWTMYGNVLSITNDLNSAELAYERVLSLKPELYEVRNKYGKLLLKLNKLKDAKKQFKIAHNSATECPETLNNLGDVYSECGKFEKAISNYKKSLEINPDLKNTHGSLGMVYLKVAKSQEAATEFLKALKLEPDNVLYLRNLAVTFSLQQKPELSVEVFKKCLKLQPENFIINLNLAMVYIQDLKNYQEAIIYLKKCMQLNPEATYVYKILSHVYQQSGDNLSAFDTCMALGDLYMDSNDHENASNIFTCATHFNPDNAYGHWKLGLTMYKQGRLDLALLSYKRAIELKPNLVAAYCDIGIIYEESNLPEKAMVNYEMAIQLDSNNLNALHNLSNLKQNLGQLDDDLIDMFQRILKIDESEAFDTHKNLADIFKTRRNFNDALTHYEKALEYNNTSVDIYKQMGDIYSELNMADDALRCFNLATHHENSVEKL
ncbi:UDP-N-acetylglucosamine--peptide N-acetylglucosaminyltransferase 110 kDa subunit-like [Myzus persicae]|uniref:UDP-N-acetylglucosamine--peptide N-acetylglucosaminyltransferase 110 kDa subunit-like n=1 Tax=Myzus persicae TaxID=13164 RepID=UPI000B9342AC|nr:UDP-N-acetylglucosamine--peptide N-acetylglucosaminyltransferase 110 kDa subunit-like [Myzus persicae]